MRAVLVISFMELFITYFERLRLTFRNTPFRLPRWSPNLLYAFLILNSVLAAIALTLMSLNSEKQTFEGIVVGIFTLLCLLYIGCVLAMIYAFFKRTMRIAQEAKSETVDTLNLVNTTLRVTLCANLSLFSSLVCTILIIVSIGVDYRGSFHVACIWITFDVSFNSFCLLCTLKKAESYYFTVFGKLHALVLPHLEGVTSSSSKLEFVGRMELGGGRSVTAQTELSVSK